MDFIYSLDEISEREAEVVVAAGEKPGGMGVAVNGSFVGEFVIDGNLVGAVPMEEGLLDGLAFGVAADRAFPFVARKFRNWRIDDIVIHGALRP